MRNEVKDFEEIMSDDPTAELSAEGMQRLEDTRETFLNTIQQTDTYISARRGKLPPGVMPKTWIDKDNAWAYSLAVWVPSISQAAKQAAREMRENGRAGSKKLDGGSGFTEENTKVPRPSQEIKKGPSGEISVE